MSSERAQALDQVEAGLDALELAGIRHRRELRLRLHVGEEELAALLYLAHHGGVPQRRLSRATGLSRSGAGAMIQRLEEQDYVRRWTDTHDRRLRLVELTEHGRTAIQRASRAWAKHLDDALSDRTIGELGSLAGTLAAIASEGDASPREEPPPDEEPAGTDPIWRLWG